MTTRARILEATLSLVEQAQGPIAMSAIAKAAGLSRQALYLTFADKADLFLALSRYVDGKRGLAPELARIRVTSDAVEALRLMIEMHARMNPGLKPIADAMELLRRQDPEADKGWQGRLDDQLAGCRALAGRLAEEGRLKPGLDVAAAADLMWTLTSLRTWDDLVSRRGWTAEDYRERMTALVMGALVA